MILTTLKFNIFIFLKISVAILISLIACKSENNHSDNHPIENKGTDDHSIYFYGECNLFTIIDEPCISDTLLKPYRVTYVPSIDSGNAKNVELFKFIAIEDPSVDPIIIRKRLNRGFWNKPYYGDELFYRAHVNTISFEGYKNF